MSTSWFPRSFLYSRFGVVGGVGLLAAVAAVGLCPPSLLTTSTLFAQAPSGEVSAEVQVLTRGPIHEAYAVPVGNDPTASQVVPKQPPADIEEIPPEVTLDDPDAEWISGYWAWDDERQDFLWVSGLWRSPPPEHRWVAGYWTEAPGGFQRISGFWAPTSIQQVTYLPAPPPSLEAGPNLPAPGPNFFWVPGHWVWTEGRYIWRPGYWAQSQEQWIWIPAYYCYTPGGYIYNAGYWDLPPVTRAVLYAPVYFRGGGYAQPGFRYSPSVLLATTQLLVHLFARPNYGSYYFGDYYDPRYLNVGYYPWYSAGGRRGWYDPFYTYNVTRYGRTNPNWADDYRRQYDFYVANRDARPRHTWDEQRRWWDEHGRDRNNRPGPDGRGDRNRDYRDNIFAVSLNEVVSNPQIIQTTLQQQVRRISREQRQGFEQRAQDRTEFAKQQRKQLEEQARADGRAQADRIAQSGQRPDRRGDRPRPGDAAGRDSKAATPTELPKLTLPGEARADRGSRGDQGPGGRGNTGRTPVDAPASTSPPTAGNQPSGVGRPDAGNPSAVRRPETPKPGIAVGEPNPNAPGRGVPNPSDLNPDPQGRDRPNPGTPSPGAPTTRDIPDPNRPGGARSRPELPMPGAPNVPGRDDRPRPGQPDRDTPRPGGDRPGVGRAGDMPTLTPPPSNIPSVTPRPRVDIPNAAPPGVTPPSPGDQPKTSPSRDDRPRGMPPGRSPAASSPGNSGTRRTDSLPPQQATPPQVSRPQERPSQLRPMPTPLQPGAVQPTFNPPAGGRGNAPTRPESRQLQPPQQTSPQPRSTIQSPPGNRDQGRPQRDARPPKSDQPGSNSDPGKSEREKKEQEKKEKEKKDK